MSYGGFSYRRGVLTQLRNTPAAPDLVDILIGEARALLQRTDLAGASRAAVVLAQTASEVEAEQTATRLVQRGSMDTTIIAFSNKRARPRQAVTGAIRTMLANWTQFTVYEGHVRRRNAVVHEGADVTPNDATESVDIASEAIGELRRR